MSARRKLAPWLLLPEGVTAAVCAAGEWMAAHDLAGKPLAEFSAADAQAFVEAVVRGYFDGQQPIIFGRGAAIQ